MTQIEIYARHGEYKALSGELTEEGKVQARALADEIGRFLKDRTLAVPVVLTGKARRAQETAVIIAHHLELSDPTVTERLGDETGKALEVSWMEEGLREWRDQNGCLIYVTHNQQAEALAKAARKRDPRYAEIVLFDVHPGGAFMIDHGAGIIYRYEGNTEDW